MLLLVVPYWINEILRAFAFRVMFGTGGVINGVLIGPGLVQRARSTFSALDVALYSGLTYAYVLIMMFPLYNAIESLDRNQVEAARDLGAPWWHIHLFVVMPLRQARHRLGRDAGVHALRGRARGAAGARRPEDAVVHADRLRPLLPGVQLAAGRGLCADPADRLHGVRADRDARCSRSACRRSRDELARSSGRAMLGFYLVLFFGFLFGPLLVMGVTAFNTPSYPQAWPIEGFTLDWFAKLFQDDRA